MMKRNGLIKLTLRKFTRLSLAVSCSLLTNLALASSKGTTTLPFTSSLGKFADALSGEALVFISVILIIALCLMLAFGEFSDGMKRMINVLLWISIAFGVTTFITTVFGATI